MLKGKIAVVTGGAQGIGQEICRKLLENNVKVALCDINVELGRNTLDQLRKTYSEDDCSFFPVDVSDKTQFKDCLNKIMEHYKSIDILINNAGVADDRFEFWEREVDINCSKQYFEKYGINVMAVLPGLTDTPILQHTEQRYIFPEMATYRDELKHCLGKMQSPMFVAECTIQALQSGKNGSLWVIEDMKSPGIVEINYTIKKK